VPPPPWISWKPYKSNPRTCRYEIRALQDQQEIQHLEDSQKTQKLKSPQEIQDPQDSFSSSDTFLTPFLQDQYKENLKRKRNENKKEQEQEEGRDYQGKGEELSAIAESRSILKGGEYRFTRVKRSKDRYSKN